MLQKLAVLASMWTPLALSEPATAAPARSFLIITDDDRSVPAGLAAQVAAAGGAVTHSIPEIGVVIASSSASGFPLSAGDIPGVDWLGGPPALAPRRRRSRASQRWSSASKAGACRHRRLKRSCVPRPTASASRGTTRHTAQGG